MVAPYYMYRMCLTIKLYACSFILGEQICTYSMANLHKIDKYSSKFEEQLLATYEKSGSLYMYVFVMFHEIAAVPLLV